MPDNQQLIDRLEKLLMHKKSKAYYAEKLGITLEQVDDLLERMRARDDAEAANYITALEDAIVSFQENVEKGTGEVVYNSSEEIRTLDELIEKCKIDTEKWEVVKYVQNYWGNQENPQWQVKAWLSKKKEDGVFQQSFIDFLSNYTPSPRPEYVPKNTHYLPYGCLVINKQDAHYNKYDVYGDNEMAKRFENIRTKVDVILEQATLTNRLEKVTYIVGSDEINSEFTNTTTKGTPQENIGTYHQSFKQICNHEVWMVETMLEYCDNLEILYVPGNHDEYVGWHIITWLSAYFKNEKRVTIDDSPRYRKYVSYGKSAMMFNHGDAMKPDRLAMIFPMEYKDGWSEHDYFYVFTGDKHHEVVQSFNGIKFYQIPAFSNAKSLWDDRSGYTGVKGEVTAFLIDKNYGMTNVLKQYL